jgi:hypothetical protein
LGRVQVWWCMHASVVALGGGGGCEELEGAVRPVAKAITSSRSRERRREAWKREAQTYLREIWVRRAEDGSEGGPEGAEGQSAGFVLYGDHQISTRTAMGRDDAREGRRVATRASKARQGNDWWWRADKRPNGRARRRGGPEAISGKGADVPCGRGECLAVAERAYTECREGEVWREK